MTHYQGHARNVRNGWKADIDWRFGVRAHRAMVCRASNALMSCVLLAAALSAPGRADTSSTALMRKNLVAIGGGRNLNFICVGSGSPGVIFEAGMGSHLLHWQKLVRPVSQLTRTCFYERAGYGYSDPSPHPSTAANAVRDLHALVERAKFPRP